MRLFGQGKLAALMGYRMVNSVIIGLCEDCRYSNLTHIRFENQTPTGIEGAQRRGGSKAHLQAFETLLLLGTPSHGACGPQNRVSGAATSM